MELPTKLDELLPLRIAAKQAEDDAAAHRRKIDAAISAHLKTDDKDEGSVTQEAGSFKVTATYTLNRKANEKAVLAAWDGLTPAVQAAFKWKPSISLTGLRALTGDDLVTVSKLYSTDVGSTSIEIKPIT